MSVWPHPIKAIIFDCDGTILDTLSIYFAANGAVLGFKYPEELAKQTNGRSEIEVCTIIVNHFNLDMTPEEFKARRGKILDKTLAESPLIPNVDDLIKKLKGMNFKMAVATSSSRSLHEIKTSKHRDLFDLFDYEICGDDVSRAKPNPDVFLKALEKLGDFKPENILVFEDAAAGVKAANSAHMPVVVLHTNNEDFQQTLKSYDAEPTIIIENFKDFDFSKFTWEP